VPLARHVQERAGCLVFIGWLCVAAFCFVLAFSYGKLAALSFVVTGALYWKLGYRIPGALLMIFGGFALWLVPGPLLILPGFL
jgi:hypothetical protein